MRRIPGSALSVPPIPLADVRDTERLKRALSAEAAYGQALQRAEADIVALTQRAVTAIVAEELALRPDHIRAIVRSRLQELRAARHLTVRVHPADLPLVPDASALALWVETGARLTLVADDSLGRGDCVLESELGEVDARIETQLARFAQLLSPRVTR